MQAMKIVLNFCLVVCFYASSMAQTQPFVLGHVDTLYSQQLSEKRVLNIYLPEGYHENDTARYPVIYLLDGGADEDFIHITGLLQYCSFSWVGYMPPSIVVGIENTDRQRDMTYPTTIADDKKQYPTTGGSAAFISFLDTELLPYIQKNYRTNQSRTLVGQSLAGLLAAEILITKPTLFNKYVIISPSLWWDDGSLMKRQLALGDPRFTRPIDIYIAVGKEGQAPGASRHIMEEDAGLLVENIKKLRRKNIHLIYDYMPAETHATIMHQAIFNAFKILYK